MNIETIQTLIEKRAKEKLNQDLSKLREFLHGNGMNISIVDTITLKDIKCIFNEREYSLRDIFWHPQNETSYGFKVLNEKLLPQYIDKEAKQFLKDVENLKEKVDELSAEIESINY